MTIKFDETILLRIERLEQQNDYLEKNKENIRRIMNENDHHCEAISVLEKARQKMNLL